MQSEWMQSLSVDWTAGSVHQGTGVLGGKRHHVHKEARQMHPGVSMSIARHDWQGTGAC